LSEKERKRIPRERGRERRTVGGREGERRKKKC